jgi:hypothetical protein
MAKTGLEILQKLRDVYNNCTDNINEEMLSRSTAIDRPIPNLIKIVIAINKAIAKTNTRITTLYLL